MFRHIAAWWKQGMRDDERSRRVVFVVSIPYTDANEIALRRTSVSEGEKALLTAARTAFPSVQDLSVRCTENPNWRG